MEDQQRVAEFIEARGLEAPPAYRLLDLVSEVGELSKDAVESTAYGHEPTEIEVGTDEVGDVLFSLLALSEALDVDAGAALDAAISKYDARIQEEGVPSSGE
jgi:NTP pyrophosphatase (non-canonical NTP hydrolase)